MKKMALLLLPVLILLTFLGIYLYRRRSFAFEGDKLGESLSAFKRSNDLVSCENVLTEEENTELKIRLDAAHEERELENDELEIKNALLEQDIARLEGRVPDYSKESRARAKESATRLALETAENALSLAPPERPLDEAGYIRCSSGSAKVFNSITVHPEYIFYHSKLARISINLFAYSTEAADTSKENVEKFEEKLQSLYGAGSQWKNGLIWNRGSQQIYSIRAGEVGFLDSGLLPPANWGK